MKLLHKELSNKILNSFYEVYRELGYGFLEKVYENSLFQELKSKGLYCEKQRSIDVFYKEKIVGRYYADLIVEDKIIIELKACAIVDEHIFQLLNYLKATDIEVGFVLSFGKEATFARRVFSNDKKKVHKSNNRNTDYTEGHE